jgi:signal transduction histidine kinase
MESSQEAPVTRPPLGVLDLAVVLACGGLTAFLIASLNLPADARTVAACVLAGIHVGALGWRRRAPEVVLALSIATALGAAAMGRPLIVLGLAPLVAVYSLSSSRPHRTAVYGLIATEIAAAIAEPLSRSGTDASTIVGNGIVIAIVWVLGYSLYSRRAYASSLEAKNRELEAMQVVLAERAVADERLRIAREMHDIVAHSISLIAVRSGVGAHLIDTDPEEARRSLKAIETVSRNALQEMRTMLDLLRNGEDAPTSPAPDLSSLRALVDGVEQAGISVDLRAEGDPDGLAPGLANTVYRVVQEGLTNVVKHSGAGRAAVDISFGASDVTIAVVDDGPRVTKTNGAPPGRGLQGMRERVNLYGGELRAEPRGNGGFEVKVRLPRRSDGE